MSFPSALRTALCRPHLTYSRAARLKSASAPEPLVTCHTINDGQVAVLTLNAPSKLNALTEPMGDALIDHVETLKTNEDIRCGIITGAGRAFSAGGDLDWLMQRHADTPSNNRSIMVNFYQRFLCLRHLPFPVIGAINGAAIGAGMCLALGGCDIRVAHTKAKMGLTFVKLGLHPGMAGTHFLPLIAGPAVAADLLLTGRIIGAEEALRMGIVSRVSDDPLATATSIASSICAVGPVAVRTTTETLRSGQECGGRSLKESMARESEAQAITYPTQDLAEGVKATQEKREPKFTGK